MGNARMMISPVTAAWLEQRAQAFAEATSGRGKPMTYGSSKKEKAS